MVYANFSVISLYTACFFCSCSKHHNRCNIHLTSELITGQLASKLLHDKSSRQFSDSCICNKKESVCENYSQTLFENNVHEDCSCIKNWLNRTSGTTSPLVFLQQCKMADYSASQVTILHLKANCSVTKLIFCFVLNLGVTINMLSYVSCKNLSRHRTDRTVSPSHHLIPMYSETAAHSNSL